MDIRAARPDDVPEIQAIYAHHVLHGAGKALVARVLEEAERAGFRQMVAVIGDSENVGSIGMHASLGFQRVGILRASGLKFGRWVDTVYMQRALGHGDASLPDERMGADEAPRLSRG